MEPPPLARFITRKSKLRLCSGGSSHNDPDVVEVMATSSHGSSSKKLKQTQVVPHDVIEIDEDEDPAGVLIIDKKVQMGNKGKATKMGYDKNWANQVKDALAQDLMIPASAEDLGLMNGVLLNPLKSFGPGSEKVDDHNDELLYYDCDELSYYVDDFSYYLQTQFDAMDLPTGVEVSIPWLEQPPTTQMMLTATSSSTFPSQFSSSRKKDKKDEIEVCLHQPAKSQKKPAAMSSSTVLSLSSSIREREEDEDEVLKKLGSFKQFDTVQDYSDHHYTHGGSKSKQMSRNWTKTIQQEWKILEKDLPDTIFVRVYEERMDLLRAVIIGAAGTPYHDGLFFFDVFFPSDYPNVPPQVYYYSGGLRLNPNLYNCGKVCLSLLNTWHGNKNEKWTPGKSTVLQVLLSIQALVLNAKPFFNEPGFERMAGGKEGEKKAQDYNENTFILSCKTMLYTLRKPPKHFEDFVAGHFRKRAQAILVACKAYMEGAQVGCLVGGGVQDVDEGDRSGSQNFKTQVGWIVGSLVQAFSKAGAKDCDQFLPQSQDNRKRTDTLQRC